MKIFVFLSIILSLKLNINFGANLAGYFSVAYRNHDFSSYPSISNFTIKRRTICLRQCLKIEKCHYTTFKNGLCHLYSIIAINSLIESENGLIYEKKNLSK